MTNTIIKTEKLVKTYQSGEEELVVLKGIDLEVSHGEFLSIIGRSGSGKSTLLYQLSLLDHPTSGKIYLEGKDTEGLTNQERTSERLKNMGYVFQDYALVPELTAIENTALPLLMLGASKTEAYSQAGEILKKIGLGDKFKNLPNHLSGGEQQRVGVARAIAHNPKILFADEPTANLDHDTASALLDILVELNKEGQTIIMVTHEKEYARRTHRVIEIFDGVISKNISSKDL